MFSCCCCSRGFATLKTDFEKNIYCPNEVAKAIMSIDNTESKVDSKGIQFAVVQNMNIVIKGHTYGISVNLVAMSKEGPKAGEKMETPMEVDLS